MSKRAFTVFCALYLFLLALILLRFVSGSSQLLEIESPFWIVIGSFFIFIMPGLVWAEITGFRAQNIWGMVALSFAVTITLEVFFLFFTILLGTSIKFWILLLFIACLLGVCVLFFQRKKCGDFKFIDQSTAVLQQPLPFKISTGILLLLIVAMSCGTYGWGENMADISGEKLLHLSFIRNYFSVPLSIDNMGMLKGIPPPNLAHFWEFMLAGWASSINMDPLPLFYRARFVIPVLGLSAMYFLSENIFKDKVKTEVVFWGVMIFSIGGFILLSPSNLDWIKADPFRGVMLFMGTAHHSDSAMDIMLPLGSGIVLMAWREQSWRNILLLVGVTIATFMWHPREFFQIGIYAGVLLVTLLLIPGREKKQVLKKAFVIIGSFLVVAILFLLLMRFFVPPSSHGYNESLLKMAAFKYALTADNFMGIRNFFNFPLHLTMSSSNAPDKVLSHQVILSYFSKDWQQYLWLMMSAVSVLILSLWGNKEDKRLSAFYIVLWFLTIAWNLSMLLLLAMTYSELHITTPRMLYIFPYLIISAAVYSLYHVAHSKLRYWERQHGSLSFMFIIGERTIYRRRLALDRYVFLFFVFLIGLCLWMWWKGGIPHAKEVTTALSVAILMAFGIIIFKPWHHENGGATNEDNALPSALIVPILGLFLLFLPVLAKDFVNTTTKIVTGYTRPINWFSDKNPFGSSPKLIAALRQSLKGEETILAEPTGRLIPSIYAPGYDIMHKCSTLIASHRLFDEFLKGLNPLFKPAKTTGTKKVEAYSLDDKAVHGWLYRHNVDCILVEEKYYELLRAYFQKRPRGYVIVFDNPDRKELLVRYAAKTTNKDNH